MGRVPIEYLIDRNGNQIQFKDKELRENIDGLTSTAREAIAGLDAAIETAEGYASSAEGSATEAAEQAQDAKESASAAAESATAAAGSAAAAAADKADFATIVAQQVAAMQVHEGQTVVDSTLIVTGAAADAKATGDAVAELKNDLVGSGLVIDDPVTLTWEEGGLNSTGQERPTTGAIRTVGYINVATNAFTAVYHITGHTETESGIVFWILIYDAAGAFVERQSIPSSAIGKIYTISVPVNSMVRIAIVPSSGSTTIVETSEGNVLVTDLTVTGYRNVTTDKTLSVENRPADAYSTGESLKAIQSEFDTISNIQHTYELIWERGYITSTGNNAGSTNTRYIRTVSAVNIEKDSFDYTIPDAYKLNIAVYDDTTSNRLVTNVTGAGTFEFESTDGHDVRFVMQHAVSSEDIAISEGENLAITTSEPLYDSVVALIDSGERDTLISYSSFSIFQKFGVIGDSFASGSIHHPDDGGWTGNYDMSWPQILARMSGAQAVNFTKGGLSTKTWLEDETYGLAKLLATEAQQLYIIALGINDNTQINAGTLTLGTIDDVNTSDYTQNPDTFFGDYGRIIGNIKAHAPYAKIVCLSVARPNERNMDTYIQQIANKYGLPFIDLTSDPYFVSMLYYASLVSNHPLVYGYAGMAKAIERLIDLDVINNTAYWGTYYGLVADDESVNPEG